MLLAPQDAHQFFGLLRQLMFFVSERRQIAPGASNPSEFSHCSTEVRVQVRDALLDRMEYIDEFVAENPFRITDQELEIVRSWRHLVFGRFIILRQLKKHAIFLSPNNPPVAYGVLSLTDRLTELIPPGLPHLVRTVLLPFKGRIVYDGLLESYADTFNPQLRRDLNALYKDLQERQRIVTSLAPGARTQVRPKPTRSKSAGGILVRSDECARTWKPSSTSRTSSAVST